MRDQGQEVEAKSPQGIRYGDVFNVTGELAFQPIAPQDAETMQTAEYAVLGAPQPGGPAALMASAATLNQYVGVVRGNQASDMARQQGITITETPIPGGKIVTEFVAGQVLVLIFKNLLHICCYLLYVRFSHESIFVCGNLFM